MTSVVAGRAGFLPPTGTGAVSWRVLTVTRTALAVTARVGALWAVAVLTGRRRAFPAAAARAVGLTDVPMLCATEIGVPNSMERVVRLLAHIQTDRPPAMVEHVYLRGAVKLRPDLVRERRPGARGPGGSTATG